MAQGELEASGICIVDAYATLSYCFGKHEAVVGNDIDLSGPEKDIV